MNDIIETHLSDFLNVDHIVDYKTHLQELVQQFGESLPNIPVSKQLAQNIANSFTILLMLPSMATEILADGHGNNKKMAQQVAAKACVDQLKATRHY